MRRLATALTISVALVLTGCAAQEPEATGDPTPSESAAAGDAPDAAQATPADVAALEAVAVEGELGAAPTLTFEQPFTVSAPVARVDLEGDGEDLVDGQKLTIDYVALSGDDGSTLISTWEQGASQSLQLGSDQIITALNDVLAGQRVGVRVLFAAPGVEATETTPAAPATVMAIEVTEATSVPTRAQGEPVEPAAGLPLVTLADDGEPEIEIPAGTPEPSELVVQPLIKGAGPAVEAGQEITVQYKGWLFDGTLFDSSWDGDPFPAPIGVGNLIAGWDEGLVGQTVGSQVLLVVPGDKGYGPEGSSSGSIPPDATLIFVVDILDAT